MDGATIFVEDASGTTGRARRRNDTARSEGMSQIDDVGYDDDGAPRRQLDGDAERGASPTSVLITAAD